MRYLKITVYFTSCVLFFYSKAFSQDYTQTQNRIKSIYAYNFMKDVSWPSFKKEGEVTICLLMNNTLYEELGKLAESRKVKERVIKLHQISSISECTECDMIFLDEESAAKNYKRNDDCKSFIVTTGFFEKGLSNIALMYQDKKLQFGINTLLCDKLGYKLSTNLSSLANQSIVAK